jgi:hypothetical protein
MFRIRGAILVLGAGLTLSACAGGSSGGSVYYDPYPYRSSIYYYHLDHYYPNRPSRPPPGTRPPPGNRPPSARPPARPQPLPARPGGGHRGGRR